MVEKYEPKQEVTSFLERGLKSLVFKNGTGLNSSLFVLTRGKLKDVPQAM